MIRLTRLNKSEIAINCDLIEWAEAVPDTAVRLISGECILVRESVEEVMHRVAEYRQTVLASAGLAAVLTSGSRAGRAALGATGRIRMVEEPRNEGERG
jgi:flagellar protein FlbD